MAVQITVTAPADRAARVTVFDGMVHTLQPGKSGDFLAYDEVTVTIEEIAPEATAPAK